jgi:predicted TIM-barrel fold metal-dependent hydrolase
MSSDILNPRPPKIIDIHSHVFPPKILSRAVESIGNFYGLSMHNDGSLERMLLESEEVGIVCSVVFSTATAVSQVHSIHNFIHQLQESSNGRLIGFGTLHPDMTREETRSEIEYILDMGLRGIKLHPDFQKIRADSDEVFALAEVVAGRLPLLIHAGDYRHSFSHPEQIRRLALTFPDLTIIAAHFGGWSEWDKAPDALAGLPNVYVDTSSTLDFVSSERAENMIARFGADHVLFGTDYPMWGAKEELDRFNRLRLSGEDRSRILFDNAAKLLSLPLM